MKSLYFGLPLLMCLTCNAINIPQPIIIDIDDVGWKRGWGTDQTGGPFRLGLPVGRMMVFEDYEVIKYISDAVGVRIRCLFIMAEFDRSNICSKYPTTTQDGSDWDNTSLVSDEDFTIMNFVKENAGAIEFGLHGVSHEHWDADSHIRTRAEWANTTNLPYTGWPIEVVQGHMQCFKELIDQYKFTFPKSVRTAAAGYYYNPDDKFDSGGLMSSWGIKYAALPPGQEYLPNHGLMVIERTGGVQWDDINRAPTSYPSSDVVTSHWPNFIDLDPAKNHEAGDKWIIWYNKIKDDPARYAAKNTAQAYSQFLYRKYSTISINSSTITIDNSKMPKWAYDLDLISSLVLKQPLKNGEHCIAEINGGPVAGYWEDRGFAYIQIPPLDKGSHTITYSVGTENLSSYADQSGTYNLTGFTSDSKNAAIEVEMYGTQVIRVKLLFEPQSVISNNPFLQIITWDYQKPFAKATISGLDMQGEKGTITFSTSPASLVTKTTLLPYTQPKSTVLYPGMGISAAPHYSIMGVPIGKRGNDNKWIINSQGPVHVIVVE